MHVWAVTRAWARRGGVPLMAVIAVLVPVVASLVTYTFVSLPGEAIALDQTGSLVALLVLLKIFVLGITHHLPFDLDKLWKHSGRREKRGLPYLLQEVGGAGLHGARACHAKITSDLNFYVLNSLLL